MQNIIFHFYYFGKSFWNVNNKKLSSFAQWTKKLPGKGCHGEERKLSKEICQNLSKCCHASIDINIYVIFCSLYSLQNCVHEVNFILGRPIDHVTGHVPPFSRSTACVTWRIYSVSGMIFQFGLSKEMFLL